MDAGEAVSAREDLGGEIDDVLRKLQDLAGVDLEAAFGKKARRNEGREW